jgi:hypothetical protein
MPIALPEMMYKRVILRETNSPNILFKSENDLRFLLIITADIRSAANARSLTGNLNWIKNEKIINPRLQKIASDKMVNLFPPDIT